MKIVFSSLVRTHLGFPSEWKGKSADGKTIKISYRYGKTNIFCDDKVIMVLTLDPFDIGGYMDDEVLEKMLKDNELL